MPLPELVQRKAKKSLELFCGASRQEGCTTPHWRYSQDDEIFTLWQIAARSGELETDLPIAQFRYHQVLGQWTLHYPCEGGRWRLYLNSGPTLDLDKLLQHLATDPFQTFWA